MTLGDLIKDFRQKNKLTMQEFADKSGLSKGYISMLEKKRHPQNNKPIIPSVETFNRVAFAMGITLNDILSLVSSDQLIDISASTIPGSDVNADYLLTGVDKDKLNKKDEKDIAKDLETLMDKLKSGEDGPASFDGEEIPEDDAEMFAAQLEIMLRRLKVINKEKYNPNKNKKK